MVSIDGMADYIPRRVVSLQPSATVTLRDLGRIDSLVACTKYCLEVCPELASSNRAIIADSWTSQSEQIMAARPDLVLASVPYQEKALAEIMKSGARFLGLAPKTLRDIYGDIRAIAGIMDAREQGLELIRHMQAKIAAVRSKTKRLARPRVFVEEWGKPLIISQYWVRELVDAAGGEFLGPAGRKISPEQVAAEQPEVLVAAWCGAGNRVPLRKIIRLRGWEALPAAQNGRVYSIADPYLNTPASTLIAGLHALAAALHPEHFPHADGLRSISAEPQ
jgi:iron complex transport system substrate-binding protein